MRKNRFWLPLATLLFPSVLFSQVHHCGTDHHLHQREASTPGLHMERMAFEKRIKKYLAQDQAAKTLAEEEIITIPIVVHVVHTNAAGTIGGFDNDNISDEQIQSQIDVLNEDFRRQNADTVNTPAAYADIAVDTKIEFCLATRDPDGNVTTGITRHYSEQASYSYVSSVDNTNLKAFGYWPSDSYLNIWVCNVSGSIIGYAQFPGLTGQQGMQGSEGEATTDGVVMDHVYFGNNVGTATGISNPYRFGRSCVHEVGHWLGLFHPWGEITGNGCTPGDYVDDTPEQSQQSVDCSLGALTSCGVDHMYQNYMDYTYDQCMNLFTQGQKNRMRAVLAVSPRRNALLSSAGCCGASGNTVAPVAYDFENAPNEEDHWHQENSDSTVTWHSHNTGHSSDGSYTIALTSSQDSTSHALFVDEVSFATVNDGFFSFDFAYSTESTEIDSLVVEYQTSCLDNWTTLRTLGPTELASHNFSGNDLSNDAWTRIDIELPTSSFENNAVQFRFIAYQVGGGTFYLDNINITPETEKLQVEIYPNPNPAGDLHIRTTFTGDQQLQLLLYDALGRLHHHEDYGITTSSQLSLDLSGLSPAIYFVRVIADDYITTKRVVVNRYEE